MIVDAGRVIGIDRAPIEVSNRGAILMNPHKS